MSGGHLDKNRFFLWPADDFFKLSFSQPLYQILCLYHDLHNYFYNISHYNKVKREAWSLGEISNKHDFQPRFHRHRQNMFYRITIDQ